MYGLTAEAIAKCARDYAAEAGLSTVLTGTELFRHCAADLAQQRWSSVVECREDHAIEPYGLNACSRVPEISDYVKAISLQEMCIHEETARDPARVGYFNPVFCAEGVREAAEDASRQERVLVVAPVRYAYLLDQFPCHATLKGNQARGALLVVSDKQDVLLTVCDAWRRNRVRHHKDRGLVQ